VQTAAIQFKRLQRRMVQRSLIQAANATTAKAAPRPREREFYYWLHKTHNVKRVLKFKNGA
jgi:hypothetical protein